MPRGPSGEEIGAWAADLAAGDLEMPPAELEGSLAYLQQRREGKGIEELIGDLRDAETRGDEQAVERLTHEIQRRRHLMKGARKRAREAASS